MKPFSLLARSAKTSKKTSVVRDVWRHTIARYESPVESPVIPQRPPFEPVRDYGTMAPNIILLYSLCAFYNVNQFSRLNTAV